ncbi:MAG TPA: hypothetical protein VFZ58_00650 [Candidatus Saccharimonadales bacterium]
MTNDTTGFPMPTPKLDGLADQFYQPPTQYMSTTDDRDAIVLIKPTPADTTEIYQMFNGVRYDFRLLEEYNRPHISCTFFWSIQEMLTMEVVDLILSFDGKTITMIFSNEKIKQERVYKRFDPKRDYGNRR